MLLMQAMMQAAGPPPIKAALLQPIQLIPQQPKILKASLDPSLEFFQLECAKIPE